LREGNIENALIWYERADDPAAKISNVLLYQHNPDLALKSILEKSLGIKTTVSKVRRIYFVENVKFHFDSIDDLGTFVEVEAIDTDNSLPVEKLKDQCKKYQLLFNIKDEDFISTSYSDMMLAKKILNVPNN
jgi:predicted adenylyl cyclase CyaB